MEQTLIALLQAPTAVSIIAVAALAKDRRAGGTKKCRTKTMGPMREMVAEWRCAGAAHLPTPGRAELDAALTEADEMLRRLCRACGGCKLAKVEVMPMPPRAA